MQSIFDAITEWLKGLLVEGIMGNLGGLFTGGNDPGGMERRGLFHDTAAL